MGEGIRICVHFCVNTWKELLKEYLVNMVEKCESLADIGKGWEDEDCFPQCFLSYETMESIFSSEIKKK